MASASAITSSSPQALPGAHPGSRVRHAFLCFDLDIDVNLFLSISEGAVTEWSEKLTLTQVYGLVSRT
jgi:hypothetical protein